MALQKINNGKKSEIDDINISNKTTYSSEKIEKEIEKIKSNLYKENRLIRKNFIDSQKISVVGKYTAEDTPTTTEKVDLIKMINELKNEIEALKGNI